MTVTARPAHGGEEVVGGGACRGVKDATTDFLYANVLCVYIYCPHVLNPTWLTSSTFCVAYIDCKGTCPSSIFIGYMHECS